MNSTSVSVNLDQRQRKSSWVIPLLGCCLLLLLAFLGEDVFFPTYSFGDGRVYQDAYKLLLGLSLKEAYLLFTIRTGAAEPVSFLLFFCSSQFIDLTTLNMFLNAFLMICIFSILKKRNVNLLVWSPFILSNFYMLVLEYSAIRLKIGIIIFCLFWLTDKSKWRWVLAIMSILAHFQIAILLFVQFCYRLTSKKQSRITNVFIISSAMLFLSQFESIWEKFRFYSSTNETGLPYKLICLFLISLVLLDRRKYAVVMFAVMLPIALLVGELRLNIIYLFMIVYDYLLSSRRTPRRKIILVLIASYLSMKGIDYSINVTHGNDYFSSATAVGLP